MGRSSYGGKLAQRNEIAKKWQWPPWLVVLFVLCWGSVMLLVAYRNVEAWRARSAIRELLDAPDGEFMVTVHGRPAPNVGTVVGAIRGVRLRMAHHTHADHEIPVVIRRNQRVLELTLGRDSAIPHEYWVFWSREGGNPNRLEIGRIETSVFDMQ